MDRSINAQLKNEKKYKYLLTIARRDGAKILFLIRKKNRIFEITLPLDIEAHKVHEYIQSILNENLTIIRYNGSKKKYNDDGEKVRCFEFVCE